MSVRSINEPQTSRLFNFSHGSINEPPAPAIRPVVSSLNPAETTIGGPSFVLYVTGRQFNAESVIVFAGYGEPTTLEQDGTLSTIVNMDVWKGPDTVKVSVFNADKQSNEVDFTFQAADAGTRSASWTTDNPDLADPDELEDEIEQAEEEGEFKSVHVSKTVSVKKTTKR